MSARVGVFVALALVLAALFVRLGIWQLDRLQERRSHSARLAGRLAQPLVAFDDLRDTLLPRRVSVEGTPDYDNEIIYTGRSHNGSPGVYLVTPVRRARSDTAVMVIRGWVYAPDAATIDPALWREARSRFEGIAYLLPRAGTTEERAAPDRKLRTLSLDAVQRRVPYPVSPMYVVGAQTDTGGGAPVRLQPPKLDNGPHLSYAIQWFSFAAIALVGAGVVVARSRRPSTGGPGGA